ncbi:MAG: ATP-binding cassette domain-containing protein [Aliishimia sp.]
MVSPLFPLSVENASVTRRGKRLLGPVNLTLPADGFTVVIGPNGAGKTTLLKVLHGIERLSEGSVSWSIATKEARNKQAYVFQRPIMLRRSVQDNLIYPLTLAGLSRRAALIQADDWAHRIGLGDAMDRPAPQLSGGEQQKLALARALIQSPDVLFLDEPCANLDGPATRDIETLLRNAHAAGTRIIMTTHSIGQVRRLASDVIFLHQGQVHEHGLRAAVLDTPQTSELAAFLIGDII